LPVGTITAIVGSAAGLLLLAAVGLLVWLRLVVQLRPKWQREKELLANRRKGVPCGAPATIVVTDIEQFSALMQLNPQLTTRALGGVRGGECPGRHWTVIGLLLHCTCSRSCFTQQCLVSNPHTCRLLRSSGVACSQNARVEW